MKKKENKIKLLLHHNYLEITKGGNRLQLPIRCAKIIHDMYENRNADNEKKDIEHYTVEYNDYEYDVQVFQMNAKDSSELQWNNIKIKPLKTEK